MHLQEDAKEYDEQQRAELSQQINDCFTKADYYDQGVYCQKTLLLHPELLKEVLEKLNKR